MFKNKHVVIAMLVAPVLSILAWLAVDYFISERPHVAESGATYALIAKSNCRYDSGQCDLENSDFSLSMRRGGIANNSMMSDYHVLTCAAKRDARPRRQRLTATAVPDDVDGRLPDLVAGDASAADLSRGDDSRRGNCARVNVVCRGPDRVFAPR